MVIEDDGPITAPDCINAMVDFAEKKGIPAGTIRLAMAKFVADEVNRLLFETANALGTATETERDLIHVTYALSEAMRFRGLPQPVELAALLGVSYCLFNELNQGNIYLEQPSVVTLGDLSTLVELLGKAESPFSCRR